MCQSVFAGWPQRIAVGGDQLRSEIHGSGDSDLLAEDGANRDFKTVPSTWHAQAWTPGDQRSKQPISGKVITDCQRVRTEVENASNASNDICERGDARKADRHAQSRLAVVRFDTDQPLCAVQRNGATIALTGVNCFDAPHGPGGKEAYHRVPIIGWRVGQLEGYAFRGGLLGACEL